MDVDTIIIIFTQGVMTFLLGIWAFFKISCESYMKEKGKNLAKKEDIKGLTRQVKDIEKEFEDYRMKSSSLHTRSENACFEINDIFHMTYIKFSNLFAYNRLAMSGDTPDSKALEYLNLKKDIQDELRRNELGLLIYKYRIFFKKPFFEKIVALSETFEIRPNYLAMTDEEFQQDHDKRFRNMDELSELFRDHIFPEESS